MNSQYKVAFVTGGKCHRLRTFLAWSECLFWLAAAVPWNAALADNFSKVYYDSRTDQLVVTMFYRGTNPDHTFSLKWGQCAKSKDGSGLTVDAEVLDSQWQDAAQQNYKKTTRFDLNDVPCRPARLTLRTAPRFYSVVQIPARTAPAP
jgi:hypothetical protein